MKIPLLEAAELVSTGVPSFDGAVEYYSTGSVQNGQVQPPEGQFTFETRPSRANRWSYTGDVLQARMQGTNKALLINDGLSKKLFSTGFLQLRPKLERCDPRYLRHYVASPAFLKERDAFAIGSTQVALTDAGARKLVIPLAPLPEQRRIVAKLENLLAKGDACQERLAKIPITLKRFRQSVLAAACSGCLTEDWWSGHLTTKDAGDSELPPGWRWGVIEELIPPGGIFDGPFGSNLKTADYTDSGVRVIRLENIGHLGFVPEKQAYISQEKYRTLTKHTVGEGDVIFASFIEEEIRVCVLPKLPTTAIAKADCFCLRPLPEIDRSYLVLQLASPESYDRLIENIHGATRPRINITQLRKLEVRLCHLEEQREIVRRVEALFSLADQIEARCARAKAHADNLTQSILAKAFRGELVPSEAEPVGH